MALLTVAHMEDALVGDEYREWIERYVIEQPQGFVRGKCTEATIAMAAAFPELMRVAGFVYCAWGRDEHWWCVAPDGTIVDPTVSQFAGPVSYEALDLNDPSHVARIPTGRCPDCGEDTYQGADFCDEGCRGRYMAYITTGRL
jgi:hypothetical protein